MGDPGDLSARIARMQASLLEIFNDNLEGALPISSQADELDAIATGINILVEELRQERLGDEAGGNERLEELLDKLRATQDQLVHSQKMEAIGRLAGGVAHDFNNLLSVMTICTAGILDRTQDATLRELAEELAHAVERAGRLTRQLLAFSRQQPSRPRTVNLNDLLVGVDRMLRRILGDDIELVTLLAVDLWPTFLDPGHVEQILVNLAVNARDAMPKGGKLTAKTRNVSVPPEGLPRLKDLPPGDYVEVTITDTGIGMDPDVAARAFEPFFTTKPIGEGTGLGLSTCYGIVKQAGGHIVLNSAKGRGTQFSIYLPRASGAPELTGETEHEGAALDGTETVLVVEDEPSVRRVIVRALANYGYRVLEAGNASEASRLFDEHDEIALLVTDLVMPYMSGFDLAKQLLERAPNLSVLYVSGYIDRPLPETGPDGKRPVLLEKPFLPRTLVKQVREILDAAAQSRAAVRVRNH